jgi:transglutaminase-like putative cysteine protease
MRTPRFLLGAVLLFWGWQTDFLVAGAVMAVVLESSSFIKLRWEFTDDDFSRIWTVCTLLFLGAAIYAFTDNAGPARFGSYFQNPTASTQSSASVATARTASAILRWLPMVLFLFMTAQAYSVREEIPLATISLILQRRWKKAKKLGRPLPAPRGMNVSYAYFVICLFAASVHPNENNTYFWGLSALLVWALWSHRTRQFNLAIWASALSLTIVLGYFGQDTIGRMQAYLQNLDPDFFSSFASRRGIDATQDTTSIGRIGRLKTSGKIVIRLEPEEGSAPPPYLRETSYRIFQSPRWKSGFWREPFEPVSEKPRGSGVWPLQPAKPTGSHVKISCYLDNQSRKDPTACTGLLPLPSGVARLTELMAFGLEKNNLGAVLAEGPGLLMFDALSEPGPTIDAPFNLSEVITNDPVARGNPDLDVPSNEKPALEKVIADLHVTGDDPDVAMRAISQYFLSHFDYSTWQEFPRLQTNETPMAYFLLRSKKGHCEYFATATVLLLRQLGIPARYAVGYAVHEVSGKEYVVRLSDAHAWCLVWNKTANAWEDFDTTPPAWVMEEAKQHSPFRLLSDLWTWLGFQFSKLRYGQTNLRPYLLMTVIPALVILFYQIFFRKKWRRHKRSDSREALVAWPGLDSEFYLVERKLADRGIIRQPNEPLTDWLRRALAEPSLKEADQPLRDLLRLHYRYRFDPAGLTRTDREELKRGTQSALSVLAGKPARG